MSEPRTLREQVEALRRLSIRAPVRYEPAAIELDVTTTPTPGSFEVECVPLLAVLALIDTHRCLDVEKRLSGQLALLIHVCQDIVSDAGTDSWPVNLDRLRMALDEIGALPREADHE